MVSTPGSTASRPASTASGAKSAGKTKAATKAKVKAPTSAAAMKKRKAEDAKAAAAQRAAENLGKSFFVSFSYCFGSSFLFQKFKERTRNSWMQTMPKLKEVRVRVLMKKGQLKMPLVFPRRQSMVQRSMMMSSKLLTPLHLYDHDVKKMKRLKRMKRMKMKWINGMRNTIKMRKEMKIWRLRLSQWLIATRIRNKMKAMICGTMGFVSLLYDIGLLTSYFLR
jgi:hypothetical protein